MKNSTATPAKSSAKARRKNRHHSLLASHIEAIRNECSETVDIFRSGRPLDEPDLHRCARLSDSLHAAQQLLESTIAHIAISRIKSGMPIRI